MSEENKTAFETELKGLIGDLNSEVKRVNGNVDKVQKEMEDFKVEAKSLKDSVADIQTKQNAKPTAEAKKLVEDAYAAAFENWERKGVEAPELKQLQTSSDTAGGYLMPSNKLNQITELAVQYAPIMELATVYNISTGDSLELPKEGTTAFANAITGETATRSATTSGTFELNRIFAYNYEANPLATQKMLDDAAFDIENYINRKIVEQIMVSFSSDAVNGTGANAPMGFAVETLTNSILSDASGALAMATLPELMTAVKPAYRKNGKFACNGSTMATIYALAIASYQPTVSWNANAGRFTLFGADVVEMSEIASISSSTYPIYYGDWAQACAVVKRQDVRVLRNPYRANGFVYFNTSMRLGFKLINELALAKMKSHTS
jgi:HK97 family phage major capsid protein